MDFGAGTELATGLRKPLRHGRHAALSRAGALRRAAGDARVRHLQPRGPALPDGDARVPGRRRRSHRRSSARIATGGSSGCATCGPDLPSGFIQAVERALSPDPAARPQTAGEFEAALTSTAQPAHRCRWTWWPARRGGRRRRRARRASRWRCSWTTVATAHGHQQSLAGCGRRAHAGHAGRRHQSFVHRQGQHVPHAQRRRDAAHGRHRASLRRHGCRCASKRRRTSTSTCSMPTTPGRSYPPVPAARPPTGQSPRAVEGSPACQATGHELVGHQRRRPRALRGHGRRRTDGGRRSLVRSGPYPAPRRAPQRRERPSPRDDIGVLRSVGGPRRRQDQCAQRARRRCCGSRRPATSRGQRETASGRLDAPADGPGGRRSR